MKITQARLKFHEYDKVDSLKEFSSHDLLKTPIIAFPKVSGHNLSAHLKHLLFLANHKLRRWISLALPRNRFKIFFLSIFNQERSHQLSLLSIKQLQSTLTELPKDLLKYISTTKLNTPDLTELSGNRLAALFYGDYKRFYVSYLKKFSNTFPKRT